MTQKGKFVISLDFELHWGVRDLRDLDYWRARLQGARRAVPAILDLFAEYGIHATWATVGFLFCSSREELMAALPGARPAYTRPVFSPYAELSHIGLNEKDDPYHFAPSLIRLITATPNQELGSHTMSHYYCMEEGQTVQSFRADLEAAVALARRFDLRLLSLVFPRNQVSERYLRVCAELGFRTYRGNPSHWLYRPRPYERESRVRRALRFADAYINISGHNTWDPGKLGGNGIADVRASRYLRPYCRPLSFLEPLRLLRICKDLDFAARSGQVYHLWFHPEDFGLDLQDNLRCLRRVLERFCRLRDRHGMESVSMSELTGAPVRAAGQAAREAANLTQM